VSENRTQFGVPLKHHVQIGATNAALGNLDEHLARPRFGTGHLLDRNLSLAYIDGCRHQGR
jgi:hypothetical protein